MTTTQNSKLANIAEWAFATVLAFNGTTRATVCKVYGSTATIKWFDSRTGRQMTMRGVLLSSLVKV